MAKPSKTKPELKQAPVQAVRVRNEYEFQRDVETAQAQVVVSHAQELIQAGSHYLAAQFLKAAASRLELAAIAQAKAEA